MFFSLCMYVCVCFVFFVCVCVFFLCVFVYLFVCLSFYPFVRLSVFLSIRPTFCPFVRLPVRSSVFLSVRSPFCPFVRLSVFLFIRPFVRLSVRSSVCLSMSLYSRVCASLVSRRPDSERLEMTPGEGGHLGSSFHVVSRAVDGGKVCEALRGVL